MNRFKPNPNYLFKADVKLRCPNDKINELINFSTMFMNSEITNDEQSIGSYMYNYMKHNKLNSIDKSTRKLTMLIDTYDEYMTFSNHYLPLLIDHRLFVDNILSLSVYDAYQGFNRFVNEFMKKRQDIICDFAKGNEKFFKISMNGSYDYDGMNSEHFFKISIVD